MSDNAHVRNSTVPDWRMRVSRRRNTSTAQSWRYDEGSWVARSHTRAHATGVRVKHVSPKQTHEVTNTNLRIRAHGSGACYGHRAEQYCQRLQGTGTPRTKSCQPWRSTSPSWSTRALSRPSSTTLATQSIVHNHGRGQKFADKSFVKDQTQVSLWWRDVEDHRKETGSCGEPSSELWTSTCSTSLTQWWWSRPRPARRPKASKRLDRERSRPSRIKSIDDQVGRDSSDSATNSLKRQVLIIQVT